MFAPFDPIEFWNRLFTAVLTLAVGMSIAEYARQKGMWGTKAWDQEKIDHELFREQQFRRIEHLRKLAAQIDKLAEAIRSAIAKKTEVRRFIDNGWAVDNEKSLAMSKAVALYESMLEETGELNDSYGMPPPNCRHWPPLDQLFRGFATYVDAIVKNAGLYNTYDQGKANVVTWLHAYRGMVEELLVQEQSLTLNPPDDVRAEIFRRDPNAIPSTLLLTLLNPPEPPANEDSKGPPQEV